MYWCFPIRFRQIPFSGFRGEVKKSLRQPEAGAANLISDRPEKHKLGRGHCVLSSCEVSSKELPRVNKTYDPVFNLRFGEYMGLVMYNMGNQMIEQFILLQVRLH